MRLTEDQRRRNARRVLRNWAIGAAVTAAIFAAMSTQHERTVDFCDACSSRRETTGTRIVFGLFGWNTSSSTSDSLLLRDGLVAEDHEHAWRPFDIQSRGMLYHSMGTGSLRVSEFADCYEYEPRFREEVRDGLARGKFTLTQIRRELEHAHDPPDTPERAAIAELVVRTRGVPTPLR